MQVVSASGSIVANEFEFFCTGIITSLVQIGWSNVSPPEPWGATLALYQIQIIPVQEKRAAKHVSPVQHTRSWRCVSLPCPGWGEGSALLTCLWVLLTGPESTGSPAAFPSHCCLLPVGPNVISLMLMSTRLQHGEAGPDLRQCPHQIPREPPCLNGFCWPFKNLAKDFLSAYCRWWVHVVLFFLLMWEFPAAWLGSVRLLCYMFASK